MDGAAPSELRFALAASALNNQEPERVHSGQHSGLACASATLDGAAPGPHARNAAPPTSARDAYAAAAAAPTTSSAQSPGQTPTERASQQQQPQVAEPAPSVRVGYVGHRGTLAELAARAAFPLLRVDSSNAPAAFDGTGFAHAVDAMDALAEREIDYFVLPTACLLTLRASFALENFSARPLEIVGEIECKPDLCLCALPGTELHECDCVMSDAGMLQACEALVMRTEADRGSPVVRQATWNNAGACHTVRDQAARGIAVLASKQAAQDAGLAVLTDALGDGAPTELSYLILGRRHGVPLQPRAACAMLKATLLATLRNQTAWLTAVTQAFDDANVYVIDIQTRVLAPSPTSRLPQHQALISFVSAARLTSEALPLPLQQRLDALSTSVSVLGSYFSITCA